MQTEMGLKGELPAESGASRAGRAGRASYLDRWQDVESPGPAPLVWTGGVARRVRRLSALTWRWLTMQYGSGVCSPHVDVTESRCALPMRRSPVAG